MPTHDFFRPPPAVPGLTNVGDRQQQHLQELSMLFGMPNRFESGRESFEQGMAMLGQAAKQDPRLTPLISSAMRILQGTSDSVSMPRRRGDQNNVSNLPRPGSFVKVKGA